MNIGRREPRAENWSELVLANATQALWTYLVPPRCEIEIVEFGNYMDTVAAWGVNYWYLTQNGVIVELAGATLLYDQIGYAAQRQPISPIRFSGGNLLNLYAVEATGANVEMGISIKYEMIYGE